MVNKDSKGIIVSASGQMEKQTGTYQFSGIVVYDNIKKNNLIIDRLSSKNRSYLEQSHLLSKIFDSKYTNTPCLDRVRVSTPQGKEELYQILCSIKGIDNQGGGESVSKLIEAIKEASNEEIYLDPKNSLKIDSVKYFGNENANRGDSFSVSWGNFLKLSKPYYLEKEIKDIILRKTTLEEIKKKEAKELRKHMANRKKMGYIGLG